MLRADRVVAVVGFGDSTGLVVKLTDMFHDKVSVPLETGVIYGVSDSEGRVHLLIESAGREIGELEGEL